MILNIFLYPWVISQTSKCCWPATIHSRQRFKKPTARSFWIIWGNVSPDPCQLFPPITFLWETLGLVFVDPSLTVLSSMLAVPSHCLNKCRCCKKILFCTVVLIRVIYFVFVFSHESDYRDSVVCSFVCSFVCLFVTNTLSSIDFNHQMPSIINQL